jgi:myosin heavy subunit
LRIYSLKPVAVLLAGTLFFSPAMAALALAQETASATPASADPDEAATIHRLALAGYLGDSKDSYLSDSLTEAQITDALLVIEKQLEGVDIQKLNPTNNQYSTQDLQALQALVEDKADDIRARKVSSWRFDNKIKKMIAALSTPAANTPAPGPTPVPTPAPLPTATPIPGPSREEFNSLQTNLKDLNQKTEDLQKNYDEKMADIEKNGEDLKKSDAQTKEQLELVKNLLDRVQGDLQKTEARLEQVAQKAEEKNITDTELEQELTVMHKDMRDNVQDVSVLKQEVAKLDKSGDVKDENVLDQVLDSKWLSGGALVVGIAALVVALSHK